MAPLSSLLVTGCLLISTVTAAGTETPFLSFPSPWTSMKGDTLWWEAYIKAADFVSQLTLTEKVNLTTGTGWEADRCIGTTGSVPRLGFRGFCLMDGPLGIRYTDKASAFPAGINVAATFSRRLMRERGEAMGEEFRGKGVDVQLGPVAGPLGRVPQGGRNWEGFSPDPYLTGVAMAETIGGIQSRGVIACAKHYILNEQEHFRGSVDVRIDDKTMHELYLWPFADAVKAGVGSVMCSYNKINGTFACENEWVQNYLLKNELGFQGFVISDWGAQHTTLGSALGGLDMAMPGDGGPQPYRAWWGGALTEAVLKGDVPQWRLDDMVMRIMAAYFRVNTGTRPEINFSPWVNTTVGPVYYSANASWQVVNEHVDVQANHAAVIREIGAKSTVLLKNLRSSALPLSKPASIAIIGNDAQDPPGGPNACKERACITGTVAMGYGSGTAEFPYLISPATALKLRAEKDGTVFSNTTGNWDLSAAKAAASNASVAIVFAAATAGENFISIDNNAGDRNNLTLWDNGDALIAAVASVNPNTIVVLHTAGPVLIDYARTHPNITAILWAGFPGQESGNSLVDVLYGDATPQGRTPFTWGKSLQDYGDAQLMFTSPTPRTPSQSFPEGVFIDYRWFTSRNISATYPFGHGLSYTTFSYSNLTVTKNSSVAGRFPPQVEGQTADAPLFGSIHLEDLEQHTAPEGFNRISPYVYPWLNLTTFNSNVTASPAVTDFPKEAQDPSAQPILAAGGWQGGNPALFDVLFTVTVDVKNTGDRKGVEIPQLYVQLGGNNNPHFVLRGFEEVPLQPGETKSVSFNLTRRDLSNWNTDKQNWEITSDKKAVSVGASVGDLRLNATLPL
ncbi:putative beta-glucosidase A [Podospora australis]|uniref:beta-glucosidase n=1 Tax=Podospora australis TaxID=1536484 RepID=A0AAN6X1L6_9PEZI|nr:putative beta-glucosidase A [Podospora australis]